MYDNIKLFFQYIYKNSPITLLLLMVFSIILFVITGGILFAAIFWVFFSLTEDYMLSNLMTMITIFGVPLVISLVVQYRKFKKESYERYYDKSKE